MTAQANNHGKLVIAGAVTAAVAGGLTAVLASGLLLGDDPATPAPGASPTTSASASASPLPTGYAAPGEVTLDPSLPDALPLPDGIWDETAPGWVLATYSPRVVWWNNETQSLDIEVTQQVVYLVSPEGQRYQVLELDPYRSISIESWTAGETEAIVRENPLTDTTGATSIEVLDLKTGEVSPYQTPFADGIVQFTFPGPVRVWDSYEGGAYIDRGGEFTPLVEGWNLALFWPSSPSPNGEWIAASSYDGDESRTGVISLATGDLTPFPALDSQGSCYPRGWTASGSLLVPCYLDYENPSQWFECDPATGAVTESAFVEPPDDAIRVDHDLWISPGVWAGNYGVWMPEADMWATVGVDDHGVLRKLALHDAQGTAFESAQAYTTVVGLIYIAGSPYPLDSFTAETVVAYDPATDRQVILLPAPPDGPGSGMEPGSWGVTSWVVSR